MVAAEGVKKARKRYGKRAKKWKEVVGRVRVAGGVCRLRARRASDVV